MIVGLAPANQMANHLWNHAVLAATARDHGRRFVDLGLDAWAGDFVRLRRDPTGGAGPGFLPTPVVTGLRRSWRGTDRRVVDRLRRASTTGRLPRWCAFVESGWASTVVRPDGVVHVDRPPFTDLLAQHRVVVTDGPLFRYADHAAFLRHAPTIVDSLRPTPAVVARARVATEAARQGRPTLVGVHVRRGDYAGFLDGRHFHDWSVYEALMRGIVSTWGGDDVAFLCTSQEPAPPGFGDGLTWGGGPGDAVGDLTALSQCDLVLGPPSTFSDWSALVGDVGRHVVEDPTVVPLREDFVRRHRPRTEGT